MDLWNNILGDVHPGEEDVVGVVQRLEPEKKGHEKDGIHEEEVEDV